MSTLRDTDEGKARPSVWPVYLAAVAVLIVGLAFIVIAFHMCVMKPVDDYFHGETYPGPPWAVLYAMLAYGHFGVIAAIGMLRVRPWAWWSAVVWTVIWIGLIMSTMYEYGLGNGEALLCGVWVLCATSLIIWPLATRRRLFFPPKPEGEE